MSKRQFRSWYLAALSLTFVMVLLSVGWLLAREPAQDPEPDEERLTHRVTEAVMNELHESDFMQKEIDAGIERFVRKQQQVRTRMPDARTEKNVRPVSVERDHIFGNPKAEISLIEYSDFECPYCKRFHPTAKRIVAAYEERVNWVYRHFPLDFHNPGAQKQAEASECAAELGGNDAFWEYSDRLYQRTRSNGKGFPIEKLVPLAVEIGLDERPFQVCLESGRHVTRIQEDIDNGTRSGIRGTPGNILLNNNTGAAMLKPGALPFQELKAEIDRLLED